MARYGGCSQQHIYYHDCHCCCSTTTTTSQPQAMNRQDEHSSESHKQTQQQQGTAEDEVDADVKKMPTKTVPFANGLTPARAVSHSMKTIVTMTTWIVKEPCTVCQSSTLLQQQQQQERNRAWRLRAPKMRPKKVVFESIQKCCSRGPRR